MKNFSSDFQLRVGDKLREWFLVAHQKERALGSITEVVQTVKDPKSSSKPMIEENATKHEEKEKFDFEFVLPKSVEAGNTSNFSKQTPPKNPEIDVSRLSSYEERSKASRKSARVFLKGLPDCPIIFASDSFLELTEYTLDGPQGAAVNNFVIQLAFSMVASKSMKIYQAISDGTVNMLDKRSDAVKALDIYRRVGQQAERLSEFYEICRNLDMGCVEKFIKVEQGWLIETQANDKTASPKEVLAIEYKKAPKTQEESPPTPPAAPPSEPVKEEEPPTHPAPVQPPPDCLLKFVTNV
ncbi:hypothetical protein HN873_005172 [Arachis hypogaea]